MTARYFPFYALVFVDGSSLTSNDSFEFRRPLVLSYYHYYYYVNIQHNYPSC